jgi:hypothetical protein
MMPGPLRIPTSSRVLELISHSRPSCYSLVYVVWSADVPVISRNEIPMSLSTPQDSLDIYVLAVLSLYIELPDTPSRASPLDEAWARRFFENDIPFDVVETALLLGSLRRRDRSPKALPLAGIRSLAYFQPVIEELLHAPVSDSYRAAVRLKMQRLREHEQA